VVSVGSDFASWVFPYAASFFGPPTKVLEVHREICDLLPCSEEKPKVHAPKTVDDQIPTTTDGDNNATKTETEEQEEPLDVLTIPYYGNVQKNRHSIGLSEFIVSSVFFMCLNGFHNNINIPRPSWLR